MHRTPLKRTQSLFQSIGCGLEICSAFYDAQDAGRTFAQPFTMHRMRPGNMQRVLRCAGRRPDVRTAFYDAQDSARKCAWRFLTCRILSGSKRNVFRGRGFWVGVIGLRRQVGNGLCEKREEKTGCFLSLKLFPCLLPPTPPGSDGAFANPFIRTISLSTRQSSRCRRGRRLCSSWR
jgi:hypothetical protein